MSRRPGDRAAQNQQTIKTLLKLEGNKHCADCKRNKHPRWASWNLGIFVCIRCSGIHRGMGTHISRVKSVDLDAWTDEQVQSVLRWGNARANKYWESKLAAGHVPSEAKIENFIRTKYESKRWVMDGPMPDPSTLDVEEDDNVPLNIVQEKAKLDRSSSQRASSSSSQPTPQPSRQPQPSFDLIGGDDPPASHPVAPPARPSTTDNPPASTKPPPSRTQSNSQLLGGLGGDFLGGTPDRPSSASSKTGSLSRPELKQSILSLYAAAPKPQAQAAEPTGQQPDRQSSFGGTQIPESGKPSAFGDLNDAFGGLSFGSGSASGSNSKAPSMQPTPASKSSPFPSFTQSPPMATKSPAAPAKITAPMSGGTFFDSGPKPPPKPAGPKQSSGPAPLTVHRVSNASDGFGEFSSALNPTSGSSIATSSNGLLDLSPQPGMANAPKLQPENKSTAPAAKTSSIFNLSAPKAPPNYNFVTQSSAPPSKTAFVGISDPWASNEWNTNEPAMMTPQTGNSQASTASVQPSTGADFGWGSSGTTKTTSNSKSPNLGAGASSMSDWGKSPQPTSAPAPAPLPSMQTDWGSSDTWSNVQSSSDRGGKGFGGSSTAATTGPPKIAPEEDFGDWGTPAPAPAPAPPPLARQESATKPQGSTVKSNAAMDDLWSNAWQ